MTLPDITNMPGFAFSELNTDSITVNAKLNANKLTKYNTKGFVRSIIKTALPYLTLPYLFYFSESTFSMKGKAERYTRT